MNRTLLSALILAAPALVACPKKAPEGPPPPGWNAQAGWPGACWYPKDWSALGPGDRRIARQEALTQMMAQWNGERGDGVQISSRVATDVETVLLGKPELIEDIASRNLAWCAAHMTAAAAGGSELAAWERKLTALPAELTAGECPYAPMTFEQHNYLDISTGWQNQVAVCEGNKVRIKASAIDKFKIEEKGAWIDVNGDTSRSTTSDMAWPCNIEGCVQGILTLRFTDEKGMETFHPVGAEYVFTAPAHGRVMISINDTTWFDNTWRTEKGITDHASVSYTPAE